MVWFETSQNEIPKRTVFKKNLAKKDVTPDPFFKFALIFAAGQNSPQEPVKPLSRSSRAPQKLLSRSSVVPQQLRKNWSGAPHLHSSLKDRKRLHNSTSASQELLSSCRAAKRILRTSTAHQELLMSLLAAPEQFLIRNSKHSQNSTTHQIIKNTVQ